MTAKTVMRQLELASTFEHLALDVVGLQETKVAGPSQSAAGKYRIYNSSVATVGYCGAAVWVHQRLLRYVHAVQPVNDRLMLARLKARRWDCTVVCMHWQPRCKMARERIALSARDRGVGQHVQA